MTDRLLIVPLVVLAVAVIAKLWDRRVLRLAEKRHRAEIEAFVAWFLECAVAYDREAIVDIGRDRTRGREHAFVYLKEGGWFAIGSRSKSGLVDFSLEIDGVGGRSMERFPPIGTRCRAPWFTARMIDLQRLIDIWPREWTRSERARRVMADRPDPLHVRHSPS